MLCKIMTSKWLLRLIDLRIKLPSNRIDYVDDDKLVA